MTLKNMFKATKKTFFAGVLAFLPIGATSFAIVFVTHKVNNFVLTIIPNRYISYIQNETFGWFWKMCVLLIVFFFFCFLGLLARFYLAQKLAKVIDFFMRKIPFFNKFYKLLQKIIEMVFDKKSQFFKQVVRIEFPHKGSYSVAFLTNHSNDQLVDSGSEYVHVFLPTSPNPTTGFFLILPENSVKILPLTVEDAMRLIISGGAIVD